MDTSNRTAASLDARRRLGDAGETLAAQLLIDDGYQIVARNWRLSSGEVRGELDLIATRDDVLAFVEVKTRRSTRFGGAAAAVTPPKQARIRRLALAFVSSVGGTRLRLRFDVVTVLVTEDRPPELLHLPGVF